MKNTTLNNKNIFCTDLVMPQCVDLEKELLGMILVEPLKLHMIANLLKPCNFYDTKHSILYKEILELYKNDLPIEIPYLNRKLHDKNLSEETGGASYLVHLTRNRLYESHIIKYVLIIIEKYISRKLIEICSNSMNSSFNNEDIFETISKLNSKLTELLSITQIFQNKDISTNIGDIIEKISKIHTDEVLYQSQWYPFNNPVLDQFALISDNNTLLVGGKSGSGKTRLIINLMRELLKYHNENISVKWYSMEDDADKLVRCFLSPIIKLTDEQMQGKNYKMTADDINNLLNCKGMFSRYDIEIVEKARSMADINIEFKTFSSLRPDRLNILIIDNIMLLNDHKSKDNQLKIDDAIARDLYDIRNSCYTNKIKSYIIALHHFTDEQLDSAALKTGYRPREKHFKGSTRLRDASTQTMLINRFANYPDIYDVYPDMDNILSKLGTIDLTKNRNGSIGLIRFFADMEYSKFNFISDYNKKN